MNLRTGIYLFAIVMVLSGLTGCRSDADRMAEFCLNYDTAVKASSDCRDMAERLNELLAPPQPGLRDRSICDGASSTACLPCRVAAREMLKRCGYEEELRPVLDQMHFSRTLRELAQDQEE